MTKELVDLLTLHHKQIGTINNSALLWNGFKNQREKELYLYGRQKAFEDALYFTKCFFNKEVATSAKLEWEPVAPKEQMTWEEAKRYELSVQVYGWRLPTRAELIEAQLDEVEQFAPDLYWSSTEDLSDSQSAWAFEFRRNEPYKWDKTKKCSVRCVRN